MLQPWESAREDSTSPQQKQATVADLSPSWKTIAVESNEQPQPQQSGNLINHSEDTTTRGMALTALKQAQQVASEFASLREHVDLSGIVEADGQAIAARRKPRPALWYCMHATHVLHSLQSLHQHQPEAVTERVESIAERRRVVGD